MHKQLLWKDNGERGGSNGSGEVADFVEWDTARCLAWHGKPRWQLLGPLACGFWVFVIMNKKLLWKGYGEDGGGFDVSIVIIDFVEWCTTWCLAWHGKPRRFIDSNVWYYWDHLLWFWVVMIRHEQLLWKDNGKRGGSNRSRAVADFVEWDTARCLAWHGKPGWFDNSNVSCFCGHFIVILSGITI